MSKSIRTVTANGGRTIAFTEWGDLDGFPVFILHGTPGSRFSRHYDESLYTQVGARIITYDRPGYGGSDRHRGRRVVDCVADVAAIADELGIERFAVAGGSGGGPHSLATAARLPERATRAACMVGPVPFDTPDFDWFEGMDPQNVTEIEWALAGEDVLTRELDARQPRYSSVSRQTPRSSSGTSGSSPRPTVPSWPGPSAMT